MASEESWSEYCAEIEDHLIEAYDDAHRSSKGDEESAFVAALGDLGDQPAHVVRNMWWESLGGQWLRAWVHTIAIVVLVAVVTVISIRMFNEFQALATQGREILNAIPRDLSTQFFVWRPVQFKVTRGAIEGPLVSGTRIKLTGRPFKNDYESLEDRTDLRGNCKFGPIRVGQYYLQIEDVELGLTWVRSVGAYPEENPGPIGLVLPEASPARVKFNIPEDILNRVPALVIETELRPSAESTLVAPVDIIVDANGTQLGIAENPASIKDSPAERNAMSNEPKLYSFTAVDQHSLELKAGAILDVVAVRTLDEQGVASSRRIPLGGERQFSIRPGELNEFRLVVDASAFAPRADG